MTWGLSVKGQGLLFQMAVMKACHSEEKLLERDWKQFLYCWNPVSIRCPEWGQQEREQQTLVQCPSALEAQGALPQLRNAQPLITRLPQSTPVSLLTSVSCKYPHKWLTVLKTLCAVKRQSNTYCCWHDYACFPLLSPYLSSELRCHFLTGVSSLRP